MKINLFDITVRDLVKDYHDDGEDGVRGYGGKLDIRPPFQREFVYKDKQRDAVIETINEGFPLNVMYWSVRQDGTYEIIDGQQRTISVAQYVNGDFPFEDRYFHNLQDDEQRAILDYQLMVYLCSGNDSERLNWFKTINIAGEKLTDQELRNAVYADTWVSAAKRYFSKTGCAAYRIGSSYLRGSPIRQDYLETAIKWINEGKIEDYMSRHQHDKTAVKLWNHFQSVINWIEATFTKKRSCRKGVDWGSLYNIYKDTDHDPDAIESETAELIMDDDVTNKSGIYPYVLTRDEKHLNIRAFTKAMKFKAYEKQAEKCPCAKLHLRYQKWKPTISLLGAKVEKPMEIIARCYVSMITAANPQNSIARLIADAPDRMRCSPQPVKRVCGTKTSKRRLRKEKGKLCPNKDEPKFIRGFVSALRESVVLLQRPTCSCATAATAVVDLSQFIPYVMAANT